MLACSVLVVLGSSLYDQGKHGHGGAITHVVGEQPFPRTEP